MGNHFFKGRAPVQVMEDIREPSVYSVSKELSYDILFGDDDPQDLCCPITQELFRDPVLLVTSGHTYEREAIEQWLTGEKRRTDPITGQSLTDFILVPNYAMKKAVDLWKKCKQRFIKLNNNCYNMQRQKFELQQSKCLLERQNVYLKQQLVNSMSDASSADLEQLSLQQKDSIPIQANLEQLRLQPNKDSIYIKCRKSKEIVY